MKFEKEKNSEGKLILSGEWGYAVIDNDKIWLPAVMVPNRLGELLHELHKRTGIKRYIFSSVLNPTEFKKHLRNIKREWLQWFPEMGEYVPCIEIEYSEMKI